MGIQRRMIPWRIEMFTRWRTVVCIPLCALALMIAACGVQTGGASGRTATSASGRATPMTAIVHTPIGAPNPSSGTGQILLLPGSSHYATSDAILCRSAFYRLLDHSYRTICCKQLAAYESMRRWVSTSSRHAGRARN